MELLAILCQMHPGYHWTSLQQGHLDGICSIRHPFSQTECFLQSCFSPVWLLAYIFVLRDVPTMHRILQFLLNSMTFLSSEFSSLLRSLWMEAWVFGVSTTLPGFVSTENLPRFPLPHHLYQLMEMLNRTGPSTDPWSALLVTGLQLEFEPLVACLWAQPFSSFLTYPTAHLAQTPTACLWGFYGRQCLKP